MFTGIIIEVGVVKQMSPQGLFEIEASLTLKNLAIGDSVAVNGCCLTVIEIGDHCFKVNVVEESLQRTSLGSLKVGDPVNLERPLSFQGKVDGHFVQGHVDHTGSIASKTAYQDGSTLVTIKTTPSITRYIVEKGSIAVDGVSLTAFSVAQEHFSFAMIPHTAKVTALGSKPVGAPVNLEVDMIAKHIEKFGGWNQ